MSRNNLLVLSVALTVLVGAMMWLARPVLATADYEFDKGDYLSEFSGNAQQAVEMLCGGSIPSRERDCEPNGIVDADWIFAPEESTWQRPLPDGTHEYARTPYNESPFGNGWHRLNNHWGGSSQARDVGFYSSRGISWWKYWANEARRDWSGSEDPEPEWHDWVSMAWADEINRESLGRNIYETLPVEYLQWLVNTESPMILGVVAPGEMDDWDCILTILAFYVASAWAADPDSPVPIDLNQHSYVLPENETTEICGSNEALRFHQMYSEDYSPETWFFEWEIWDPIQNVVEDTLDMIGIRIWPN